MAKRLTFAKVFVSMTFSTALIAFLCFSRRSLPFFHDIPSDYYGHALWMYFFKLCWALPMSLLILYYSKSLSFSFKEMFSKSNLKPSWKPILIITGLIYVCQLVINLVKHGKFQLPQDYDYFTTTIKYLIVGFSEELIFRAWAFNAFKSVTSVKKAYILQATFFVLAHWASTFVMLIYGRSFSDTNFLQNLIQTPYYILLACIFSYILNRYKSLWAGIIVHTVLDITGAVLVLN
jgi:membrane protease YdiL (CAAX protease family)